MIQPSEATILVVDDVEKNIKLLSAILRSAGYEVVTAADGPTALRVAHEVRPDLVLLDVMMPVMDGYVVCNRLKEDVETRDIPVIFVSAKGDTEAETRGFSEGGADYITKPIQLPVLLARVKAHLTLFAQRKGLQSMFHDVIEFAPEAFLLMDQKGFLVHVNAQAKLEFGYDRDELIGMSIGALTPKGLLCRDANFDCDPSGTQKGIVAERGIVCLRKNGTEFPADINWGILESNHGGLFMAAVRNVSERYKVELELTRSRQRLRKLAAQSEAKIEEERKHMAREIHDELGQVLTALRMDLALLQMRSDVLDDFLIPKVASMKTLVDRAIEGVRSVASSLRPVGLDLGFLPALKIQCDEFTLRTQVACSFQTEGTIVKLADERSILVYRIIQESLTNVARHANATQVCVTLEFLADSMKLTVQDNGRGFDADPSIQRKSFGLLGMHERAIALGGELHVDSKKGQGARIAVTLPIFKDLGDNTT